MMTVATSRLSFLDLLKEQGPSGWFGRTSLASCHQTEDGILVPFSEGWSNSGMGSPTECLTLSTLEWPSAAAVCSLSDVLETQPVPQRFFLSATACKGILRRADKRGKTLPVRLQEALLAVAQENLTEQNHFIPDVGTMRAQSGHFSNSADASYIIPWPAEIAPTLNAHFGEKMGLENQHIAGGGGLFVLGEMPDNWSGTEIRSRDRDLNPHARRRLRCSYL
jgi:hypothetical protein